MCVCEFGVFSRDAPCILSSHRGDGVAPRRCDGVPAAGGRGSRVWSTKVVRSAARAGPTRPLPASAPAAASAGASASSLMAPSLEEWTKAA